MKSLIERYRAEILREACGALVERGGYLVPGGGPAAGLLSIELREQPRTGVVLAEIYVAPDDLGTGYDWLRHPLRVEPVLPHHCAEAIRLRAQFVAGTAWSHIDRFERGADEYASESHCTLA